MLFLIFISDIFNQTMGSQEMIMKTIKPQEIHLVSTTDSEEHNLLLWSLNHSSVVGLDAEWACSNQIRKYAFPIVALLQMACRVNDDEQNNSRILVFLVDLQGFILSSALSSIYQLLRDLFISPHILKLGFTFKQDFAYLSSTFASHGCHPGFDKLAPFIDISTIYHEDKLQQKQPGKEVSHNLTGLATVCKEVLGVTLSKELQRSDWSSRPLTEDQKTYAAADAQCLLEIFDVFEEKVLKEVALYSQASCIKSTSPLTNSLLNTIGRYGERIFLKDSDRNPKTAKTPPQPLSKKSKKKKHKLLAALHKIRKPTTSADITKQPKLMEGCGDSQEAKLIESHGGLQGPSPGDSSLTILTPPGEILRPTTSTVVAREAKPMEGCGDLQVPAPGDSSLFIDCGDLEGDGCAKVVTNKASVSQPAQANVAKSNPNRGGHSSTKDYVVCQLCDKPFHTASDCYKRFKKTFKTERRGDLQGPSQGECSCIILTPPGEILRRSTSADLTKETKLIQGCGDLQGHPPHKINEQNKAHVSQPAQANVAESTPTCGRHSSTKGSHVVCQLCKALFHTASDCSKRFDKSFKPPQGQKPRRPKKRTQAASSQPPSAPVVYVAPSALTSEAEISRPRMY